MEFGASIVGEEHSVICLPLDWGLFALHQNFYSDSPQWGGVPVEPSNDGTSEEKLPVTVKETLFQSFSHHSKLFQGVLLRFGMECCEDKGHWSGQWAIIDFFFHTVWCVCV